MFLNKCDESDWLLHRLLFLERHRYITPNYRPTDIKAETNVYNHNQSERSFLLDLFTLNYVVTLVIK